jgi:hypothetical protein
LSGLTSAQVENRDATEAATKAIYEQTNAHLGLRGAQLNTRDSLDSYNQVLGNSASTDVQKQKALLSVEQAFYQQEQAAYQAAYADSKATTEAGKVAEAQAAANRETVNLADSFKGPLPESLQETISKMDLTSARAAGLTVDVDKGVFEVSRALLDVGRCGWLRSVIVGVGWWGCGSRRRCGLQV